MSTWTIEGGAPFDGDVRVSGFKHALVPLVAAAVLARRPVRLANVPDIEDTRMLVDALAAAGARADVVGDEVRIDARSLDGHRVPAETSRRGHGSLYLLPVLLARHGWAEVGPTGGCRIGDAASGARPLHHVAAVLERFGAEAAVEGETISARCRGLTGTVVRLRDFADRGPDGHLTGPLYSGATKTAILLAATASGVSVLEEPYAKPDVTELVAGLRTAGVPMAWDGPSLVIEGRPDGIDGFEHVLSPDVLELLTFLVAGLYVGGEVTVAGADEEQVQAGLAAELACLAAMGVDVRRRGDRMTASVDGSLRPLDVRVSSHGIFSDSHPLLALLALDADGPSCIEETVWTERFAYVEGLCRLGADVVRSGARVRVAPGRAWRAGEHVVAGDLRAAAVYVVAALGIDGTTRVDGVEHLDRGYAGFLANLRRLGASIEVDG